MSVDILVAMIIVNMGEVVIVVNVRRKRTIMSIETEKAEGIISYNDCECWYYDYTLSLYPDTECTNFHVWSKIEKKSVNDYELYENILFINNVIIKNKWEELGEIPHSWKIKALQLKKEAWKDKPETVIDIVRTNRFITYVIKLIEEKENLR